MDPAARYAVGLPRQAHAPVRRRPFDDVADFQSRPIAPSPTLTLSRPGSAARARGACSSTGGWTTPGRDRAIVQAPSLVPDPPTRAPHRPLDQPTQHVHVLRVTSGRAVDRLDPTTFTACCGAHRAGTSAQDGLLGETRAWPPRRRASSGTSGRRRPADSPRASRRAHRGGLRDVRRAGRPAARLRVEASWSARAHAGSARASAAGRDGGIPIAHRSRPECRTIVYRPLRLPRRRRRQRRRLRRAVRSERRVWEPHGLLTLAATEFEAMSHEPPASRCGPPWSPSVVRLIVRWRAVGVYLRGCVACRMVRRRALAAAR